jgi:hypothetical protein
MINLHKATGLQEFMVCVLCAAGTTLTHLGPFGNAMQRQLDQALKELIALCRSSTTRYKLAKLIKESHKAQIKSYRNSIQ